MQAAVEAKDADKVSKLAAELKTLQEKFEKLKSDAEAKQKELMDSKQKLVTLNDSIQNLNKAEVEA